jgi:hypothetical protein
LTRITTSEFSALPTAAGLVVAPLTDDLDMRVTQSRVTHRSSERPAADRTVACDGGFAGRARIDQRRAVLPRSRRLGPRRRRELSRRRSAGSARPSPQDGPDEANRARIALARFYLGNGFGAEALGLIELTQAGDPSLQGDLQLQTMRAAADFIMGRYHDAHNDIAGQAFDNNRHAAFWRGLTEAALEDWDGARKALALADPVLHRYPAEWQARARIAEATAALQLPAASKPRIQDLARLPPNLPKPVMLDAQLVRAQLYAQEGRTRMMRWICSKPSKTAATNTWLPKRSTTASKRGLASGALSQDAAISQLEMLRYRWRGDVLELKTLRKLGCALFPKQRWHDGLQILAHRVAEFSQ